MRNLLWVLFVVLSAASATFAATFSDASLKGTYAFQLAGSHYEGWSASITCYDAQGNPYTVWAGGNDVGTDSVVGAITFDGKGNATGTYTQYGKFDQAATNATAVPSCTPGASNNGYAVYDAPTSGTFSGTYSVQTNGTGALALTTSGEDTPTFVLELAGTAAIRTAVLITEYDSTTNKVEISGYAILQ